MTLRETGVRLSGLLTAAARPEPVRQVTVAVGTALAAAQCRPRYASRDTTIGA